MILGITATLMLAGITTGCSDEADDALSCETGEDCEQGFICEENICVEGEDENGEDEIPEIVDEHYRISLFGRSLASLPPRVAEVRLLGSLDGTDHDLLTEALEEELDCANARFCGMTENLEYFVAAVDNPTVGFDIYAAAMDASIPEVTGGPQLVLEGVYNPRLRNNGVIYDLIEAEQYVAYYQEFGSGEAQQVAMLASTTSNPGQFWDADPVADRAVVLVPTLQSVDIRIGTISGGVTANDLAINLGRNNLPDNVGSLYVGQLPVGFSSDGRYMAIRTVGPNAHGACVLNSDCQGTSQVCGLDDRCVAIETTVRIFDLEHINTLEDPCNSHEECGPVHRCDSPGEDFELGQCMPQRTVVGVPHSPSQGSPVVTGCEATRADGSYSYTDIRAPFTFGPDNRLYMVGQRNCVKDRASGDATEANIPKAAILAVDLATGEFEEVFGNIGGEDFSDARCYNEATRETVVDDCIIDISAARLSPEGNDVVFLGTNPTVTSTSLAAEIFDIWRVRRDGEDHEWLGETSQQFRINDFLVHP